MTDNVAVVEYGSHAIRAGLAYNFPSDQEPRLVSTTSRHYPGPSSASRSLVHRKTNLILSNTLLQVLPASVRSIPPDGSAERPAGAQLFKNEPTTDSGVRAVVEDGNIVNWPGFETLLHHILYQQVRICCSISSL